MNDPMTIRCPHPECGRWPTEFDSFNWQGLRLHLMHAHRVGPIRAERLAREAAGIQEAKLSRFAGGLFAAGDRIDEAVANREPLDRLAVRMREGLR